MLTIKTAGADDRREWQRLWGENCAHFGAADMDDAVVDGLWLRIINDAYPMQAWLAVGDAGSVGLAHTILHPHTFSLKSVCYLEDLWVSPRARGAGVATALIGHLEHHGKREGWRRIYWETDAQNSQAQHLYERIASRRQSIIYQIDTAS
ncbi:MAG: N-acetyltransferase [Rhizobiaceae bacterium MnEN-MB40S]|nr:MAG: N-acetyltransferase [Rhizobiaceae bacterium MnEN-MB40S]